VSNADRAVNCFKQGFSCSQAILSTYAESFGLQRDAALRVAGAFGAGMGRMGLTCGAVTGAFMVIGLKYTKTAAEDEETKEKAYALVSEFCKRFHSIHGSIACRELLGCDISTEDGLARARNERLFELRCPEFVSEAAEILDEMLGHSIT